MSKRGVKIFFICLCLITTIVLGGLISWQYKEYSKVQKAYQAKAQEFAQLEAEIEEIKRMLDRYEEEKKEFTKYLFDERDIPAFLDEISKNAQKANVEVIDMQTKRFHRVEIPKAKTNYSTVLASDTTDGTKEDEILARQRQKERIFTLSAMPIVIKLNGTFTSLTRFLDHLQDYEQLINISGVDMRVSQEYPILNCQFTISIYSLKTLSELESI